MSEVSFSPPGTVAVKEFGILPSSAVHQESRDPTTSRGSQHENSLATNQISPFGNIKLFRVYASD